MSTIGNVALAVGGLTAAGAVAYAVLRDDDAKVASSDIASRNHELEPSEPSPLPTPIEPAPVSTSQGMPVRDAVDGLMELYDADKNGKLTFEPTLGDASKGESVRTQVGMHITPHGPNTRSLDTYSIAPLLIAADGLDGAFNGSVSRLELMTVVGSFDLHGGDDPATGSRRDQALDHQEKRSYEMLFRERIVDRQPAPGGNGILDQMR